MSACPGRTSGHQPCRHQEHLCEWTGAVGSTERSSSPRGGMGAGSRRSGPSRRSITRTATRSSRSEPVRATSPDCRARKSFASSRIPRCDNIKAASRRPPARHDARAVTHAPRHRRDRDLHAARSSAPKEFMSRYPIHEPPAARQSHVEIDHECPPGDRGHDTRTPPTAMPSIPILRLNGIHAGCAPAGQCLARDRKRPAIIDRLRSMTRALHELTTTSPMEHKTADT